MSQTTKLLSSILLASITLATLAACSAASPTPATLHCAAAQRVGHCITVTAVDIALSSGDAFLAPDESGIAWTDGSRICLYSLSGERQACATSENGIDPNSVSWSPDVQYIVFTEDLWGSLKEPDAWVLMSTHSN